MPAIRKILTRTADGNLRLAEFENQRGNSLFDDAMSGALAILLDQSPHLTMLSSRRVGETRVGLKRPATQRISHTVARETAPASRPTRVAMP